LSLSSFALPSNSQFRMPDASVFKISSPILPMCWSWWSGFLLDLDACHRLQVSLERLSLNEGLASKMDDDQRREGEGRKKLLKFTGHPRAAYGARPPQPTASGRGIFGRI
jgi:hypothetical protein